jgi:adenosine deaminase
MASWRKEPLADLHRHLDGSLRLSTLRELASELGVDVPEDVRFQPNMGLEAALARFAVTLSVLQRPDAVRRVADEMCEDAATEGVETLEIRFAPQLHRAAPQDEIVDAALDGVAGRAGLILCGLHGEPPSVLSDLVRIAASRPGVVGIDLAGGPTPDHDFSLSDYAMPFEAARELGIGRTVHAAEGRPVEEIRVAVERLLAQRIGHGTTLLDDRAIVDLVLERGVAIEACPTSNVHTGVIASVADHPLGRWLALGVDVCVNTDNTLLSDVDLPTELERTLAIDSVDDAALRRMIQTGRRRAFTRR